MASLYLAPTTHTALHHAVARIHAAQRAHPLAPVYLLLPDAEAIREARRYLGSTLAVHLVQIYRLARAILDEANSPVSELSDPATRRLLLHLLDEMRDAGELTTFAPMRDKPGFVRALRGWLREMKSQGIPPAEVRAAATTPRDAQLATLYERYQAFLHRHQRSDADGLLWLATEALSADPTLFARSAPLLVLGFDQFTPIQRALLHHLDARLPHLGIYLLWEETLPPTSLALTRLRATRAALDAALPGLHVHPLAEIDPPAPPLVHLRRTLFESAVPHADSEPPIVQAIAAPSREAEVRGALRAIKQRLLGGEDPEDIALLAPQPAPYQRLVHAIATEYGVPVRYEQNLLFNPAITALLNALHLAPAFPWRESFDLLRSPYQRQPWLDAAQLDLLDRLTRQRPVVSEPEQWFYALKPLALELDNWREEEFGAPPLVATTPSDDLARLEAGLRALFDHLTPPPSATPHHYTLWLQERLLGLFPDTDPASPRPPTLDLLACCQAQPESRDRDRQALLLLLRAMRALLDAATLLPDAPESVSWSQYRSDLVAILSGMVLRPDGGHPAVRFGPLEAGRAVTIRHLYVLGLSEGEFPRPPDPDLFYTPDERATHPLPLQHPDPTEDASLWWQLLSNCRASLTLLRPRLDESGTPWLPSPYWEATVARVEGLAERVVEPPVDALPLPDDAACRSELLVALALAGAAVVPPEVVATWRATRAAHAVLARRQRRREPPGPHEGTLTDPTLRDEVAARYGSDHAWSASRLSRYGQCPYGFFAEQVLKLEPRPDPTEGLDARQRGSVLHALLEHLYRCLAEADLRPSPATRDAILALLDECCARLFPSAPQRYGFRPTILWEHEQAELRRVVRALVAWECQSERDDGFQPFYQEIRFGLSRHGLAALPLQAETGVGFLLHGVIDRVDRDGAGRLRIIDYKSGSRTYSESAIEQGLALQTALYALAVECLLPDAPQVVESFYLHLTTRKTSGRLQFRGPVASNPTVQAAISRAATFVAEIRAGQFPSTPGNPVPGTRACTESCDFAPLCRVQRSG